MDAPDGHRRFRVFRFKRGGGRDGYFDEFVVPVGPRTTVLDALLWIQLHRDRSLALRHSCLHASCGTCGVLVNGREALACVTPAADRGQVVTVEPLANVPVLTDLVVDMGGFYARFPDPHPTLRTSEAPAAAEARRGIVAPSRFEDCLECALCLSACPIASTSGRYAGPAALSVAQRLLEEPRRADIRSVLDWADRPEGAWRCHAAYECTEVCPADARPAERIMALRGELLRGRRRNERS